MRVKGVWGNFRICEGQEGLSGPGGVRGYNGCRGLVGMGSLECRGLGM